MPPEPDYSQLPIISDEDYSNLPIINDRQGRRPLSVRESIGAAIGEFADAPSFGFANKAAAGLRSVLPGYSSYEEELAALESGANRFREDNPIGATTLNLLGNVPAVIGTAGMGTLATRLPLIGRALSGMGSSGLGRIAQAAGIGGITGALGGAGEAAPGQELAGALEGGKFGTVLGAGLGGAGEGVSALARHLARGAEEAALGIRGADIAKGYRRGEDFIDSAGNVIDRSADKYALEAAVDTVGNIEQKVELLRNKGILDEITNSPTKAKATLARNVASTSRQVDSLLEDVVKQPAPVLPDLTRAVDKAAEFTESVASPVFDDLVKDTRKWQRSDKTIGDLLELKREIGSTKGLFSDTAGSVESTKGQVYRTLYGIVKEAAEDSIDALKPEAAGQFRDLNKTLEALYTFEDTVTDRIGKSSQGILSNALGLRQLGGAMLARSGAPMIDYPLGAATAASAASRVAPASASRIYQALAEALNPTIEGYVGGALAPSLADIAQSSNPRMSPMLDYRY